MKLKNIQQYSCNKCEKESSGVRLNDTRLNFAVFSFFPDVNDDDADVYDDPFHDIFHALNYSIFTFRCDNLRGLNEWKKSNEAQKFIDRLKVFFIDYSFIKIE